MHSLEDLYLSSNPVSNISALKSLSQLNTVDLYNTSVIELESLLESGLDNGDSLKVSGCLDLTGYSRPLLVAQQLEKRGVTVDFPSPYGEHDCPDTLGNTQVLASASLSGQQLMLDWNILTPWDDKLWHCELHLNLDQQLDRVPAKVFDSCPTNQSAVLEEFQAPSYTPTLIFDNGLGARIVKELPKVSMVNRPINPVLESVDWGQIVLKSNPKLVPGRDALIRAHVTAPTASETPDVSLMLKHNQNSLRIVMDKPRSIRDEKQHQSLDYSYNAVVPAKWIQQGLSLDIELNGTTVKSLTPSFANQAKLYITVVPIQIGSQIARVPSTDDMINQVKRFWPFAEVEIRTRSVFKASDATPYYGAMDSALSQLDDLRAVEGDPSYYVGYVPQYSADGDTLGIAYTPGFTSAVLDKQGDIDTLANELGHNFGLPHVDCGGAYGVDTNYPYSNRCTGSVGINQELNGLLLPAIYTDVMSYCEPKHVSDYNFERVQDFIAFNPPQAFKTSASKTSTLSSQERSLYISGQIDAKGNVTIRTIVPLNRPAKAQGGGEYQIRVVTKQQQVITKNLRLPQLDHKKPGQSQYFNVILPFAEVQSLEILKQRVAIYSYVTTAAQYASPAPRVGSVEEPPLARSAYDLQQ